MLRALAFALALHGAVIHGLILRTQKNSDSTAQSEKMNFMDAMESYKTLSAQPEAKLSAEYFFDFTRCIMSLPYNEYFSYEGASFCRINAYSCNNLWPEELHTEVSEGTFCLVNAFEQNQAPAETEAAVRMYHELAITIAKYYTMAMEATKYQYYDVSGSSGNSIPTPDANGVAFLQSCNTMSSDKLKIKCMIEELKIRLSETKNSKPDMSNLTPTQTHRLLQTMQNLSTHTAFLQEATHVSNEMLSMPEVPFNTLTPLPFVSSLGKWFYSASAMQGHVGPVSGVFRFSWEHVQPGLTMSKFELSTVDPRALCNDGSGAIMYMGEFTSKTKWHLHIDGGYFCFDKQTCLGRALFSPGLVSTKGWEQEKNISGMFDPHLGGFSDFTHAAVQYCSSDAWFGQTETEEFIMVGGTKLENGKFGTYFRGFTIVQAALLKYLMMGMGATPGQELFISGCSAGSIAATAQADSWNSRLQLMAGEHQIAYHSPKIWTLLDGAPIVSPPAVSKSYGEAITLFEMAMKLVGMIYGDPEGPSPDIFLNKDCVAQHPDAPGECAWTVTVLPFIKTPNIVLAQTWDNFVDGEIYGFFTPTTAKSYSMGMDVVALTRATMKTCTPQQNYWTVGCGDHCLSSNPFWWRLAPATAPGADAFITAKEATIMTREGKLGRIIADTCDSYNCGCVGQSSAYNKLAATALFFQILSQLTPWTNKNLPNLPTPVVTAIASNQVNNPLQMITP